MGTFAGREEKAPNKSLALLLRILFF